MPPIDPTVLAGPIGALVVLLWNVYQFSTGKWVPRERLVEKERDRQQLLKLVDTMARGQEISAQSWAKVLSEQSSPLSASAAQAEAQIADRRTRSGARYGRKSSE